VVKFKRRQLLLGGLAASISARLGFNAWQRRRQPQLENLIDTYGDVGDLINHALDNDLAGVEELIRLKRSVYLIPPPVPYDRQMSRLLALCCRLSTEQYIYGRYDPGYDGAIEILPSYAEDLNGFTQVTAFQGPETRITQTINLKVPDPSEIHGEGPVGSSLNQLSETTHEFLQKSISLRRQDRVYMGFALVSQSAIILAFRGTQRSAEWLTDLLALPIPYLDPLTKTSYGKVHSGFFKADQGIIDPSPYTALRNLNPALPCYITGHSLGGAIATLTAMDLALAMPDLQEQLRLYTYASPRVGDPEFVLAHNQLIPNSYRIFNLADMIPMFPPIKLTSPYAHVGQEWSFLSQQGDPLLNHRIDTYQYAVNREYEQETKGSEKYANLRVIWRQR
jgi:triacylglycerol lipase